MLIALILFYVIQNHCINYSAAFEINLEFSRRLRSSPAEQMNLTIVLALFLPR